MNPIIPAIIGAVIAVGIGVVIFTQRKRIGSMQSSVSQGASSARAKLSRNLDARYRSEIIKLANRWHIAETVVELEMIAIEPQFYTLPRPHNPNDNDEDALDYDGPLTILSRTPDWPHAVAPYRLPGIGFHNILRGEDHIALLGLPGSGRTVTLALMALSAARQVEDGEEGAIMEEARLPILIHLADLDLTIEEYGESDVDPLLPLLEAARSQIGGLASRTVSAIRGPFAAGRGLILIDGLDEVPRLHQNQAVEWLDALLTTYPGNKVVIAGPVRGYHPLQNIGIAPVFMIPWSHHEFTELGERWADAWVTIGETDDGPAPRPNDELVWRSLRGMRVRTPLDVSLKLWATFAKDDSGKRRGGWYESYIKRIIPAKHHPLLYQIARNAHDQIDEVGMPLSEINALTGRSPEGDTDGKLSDIMYAATQESHLMTERVGGRMTFSNPVIAAYLAARGYDESFHEELLDDRLDNRLLMPFLAQYQDVTDYVERHLNSAPSILHEHILEVSAWAADADPNAEWRDRVFKKLATYVIGPVEYPLMRERAMSALIASGDRNINFIFMQGLKGGDQMIRILSTIGLGAVGDPEMVTTLGALVQDPDPGVEMAAALALGAIGTKPAVNFMIESLLAGTDMARRAAGEMLGLDLAGEGHDILKEAVNEQDPSTRRAAVYGLERISEDWVIDMLKGIEMRDDQWIVRSAAASAIARLEGSDTNVPYLPPQPDEHSWLASWLGERGAGAAPGREGVGQLVRSLQEGDPAIRLAAAEALGVLALPENITPLYAALRDEHPEVRDSAYRALGIVSLSTGKVLPGVL